MELSKRLQIIHDLVPKSVVADVGADHGKLIISLFEDGIITHGYAIENKKGPFKRLSNEITSRGLENDIVPLFSDGIKDIPDIVNTVVIAGMGASNIINILKKSSDKLAHITTIIVDAHTKIPYVREEISKMGYIISDEKIVFEGGIYYEIIKFTKSSQGIYSKSELEFGPILSKEKGTTFKQKYIGRLHEIEQLIESHNLPIDRINKLNEEKERINKVL